MAIKISSWTNVTWHHMFFVQNWWDLLTDEEWKYHRVA